MTRLFILVVLAWLLVGCGAFKPYESVQTGPRVKVTISKNTNSAKLGVVIFEPDNTCDFTFMGRVDLKGEENTRTIYMPARRAYFRVSAKQAGYHSIGLRDVSFVLEDNQEYSIEFEWKGAESSWTGTKGLFDIKYLQHKSGDPSKPVEADHFSICEREHGLPSD